jgi:hypothetical protein
MLALLASLASLACSPEVIAADMLGSGGMWSDVVTDH